MSENILQNIIKKKELRIAELKKKKPLESIKKNMPDSMNYLNFKETIEENIKNNNISIIAEIKKASPSAGILFENYNPVDIAKIYFKNGATCLSVLTEEDFFLGNLSHIYKIKSLSNPMEPPGPENHCIPILCKDFFIDVYQVQLAKYYGADAILIILAGVDEKTADELYEEAKKLEMSVIVEVHTVEEAKKSLKYKDALIGINNRNLKTLKTNLNTTYDIHNILINHRGPLISESGIKNKEDVLKIASETKIKTFLIGESILKNLENNNIFSVL